MLVKYILNQSGKPKILVKLHSAENLDWYYKENDIKLIKLRKLRKDQQY